MTNTQLYLAIFVPVLFNGMMFTVLFIHIDKRIDALDKLFQERLRRVEEVLDARLRLIEDRLGIR
jgi:hypothetical protein